MSRQAPFKGPGFPPLPGVLQHFARRQRGVALILVLWFVVLLGVLALGLSKVSRNSALIARQLSGATQARHLAEGGVQLLLGNLLMASDDERLLGDGEEFALSFKQGKVALLLWNESGKVDINRASEALLARLFEAHELPPEQSEALAAAIADWRDEDDLARLHGAEDEDYWAAGLAYGAADSAFTSVSELRKVLGMDESFYQQIEADVTIYSKSEGVNPKVAPLSVLLAVSDVELSALEHYIEERRRTHRAGLPLPPVPLVEQSFIVNDEAAVFTLSALATTTQGSIGGHSVVFELIENAGKTRATKLYSQPHAISTAHQKGQGRTGQGQTGKRHMRVEEK
ncbi:MAG: general secretion pathway protein GspK [Gammaproteobacteria bacterium]|nr:general secretion pathway protein GspK [Gammaproteobacteria bacterium]MBQ0838744.1 general secretion pathway protein GspK [Gammaproteobacteria bacterium]